MAQLISLLMHDEPCVYDTNNLPNMEELGSDTAQTRPLNEFEVEAIEKLKSKEKILVRATQNRILMVGSIRAQKSCLQCHAVKKNDLLGASLTNSFENQRSRKTKKLVSTKSCVPKLMRRKSLFDSCCWNLRKTIDRIREGKRNQEREDTSCEQAHVRRDQL